MIRSVPTALTSALIALLVLAAAASASVQVGSSGWQWGNPLPQGNTINAISFAGTTGYAAGDFGSILATSDGGSTWSGLSSGTFTNLGIVQAIDGDSLFAGGGCVGRRSDDGGKTFKRVAFTPVESSCRQRLAAAWFVDPQIGYLVLADGTVLRTDNNGDTFAQKIAVPGTAATGGRGSVTDVRFLDASNGVATGPSAPSVGGFGTRAGRLDRAGGADRSGRSGQHLPHGRRRELLDRRQGRHARGPRAALPGREERFRGRRQRDVPGHRRRRPDVDQQAARRGRLAQAEPALDLLRLGAALRDVHGRQPDRAHDRRRRDGVGRDRGSRTRSARSASHRRRASRRSAAAARRRSPTTPAQPSSPSAGACPAATSRWSRGRRT